MNIADYHIIYNTLIKILPTLKKKLLSISIASCVILKRRMMKLHVISLRNCSSADKRYDLGEVGRYRINSKLGLDIQLRSAEY